MNGRERLLQIFDEREQAMTRSIEAMTIGLFTTHDNGVDNTATSIERKVTWRRSIREARGHLLNLAQEQGG